MSSSEKKKASHKHYTLAGLEGGKVNARAPSDSESVQSKDSVHNKHKSKYGAVKD